MTKISGKNIIHTKGDTLRLTVTIEGYEKTEGDSCRFACKKAYSNTNTMINTEMALSDGQATLYVTADTMKTLPAGNYVYDIEITRANGDVETIIGQESSGATAPYLQILEEVD